MNILLFIFNSPQEWILVILVVFLLFGATRLPQLAKSLGQTRKAFKDGMREAEEEEKREAEARQQISPAPVTPQISELSDEALAEELRRRAETKQA
ncbi:MAG: twin-arginine translocase TatA/TatE family subunit [Acidobacteria bacterium]|nr:twin-arginine translocase TatA/TatE family subunit [Acidobacteriota bacterium]MCW5950225.1 twin-arginine translocase TatA/TatE family subunit [Pyrinomonadaceae bacterium]